MSTRLEYPITVGERGRMVLPAPIRERLEPQGGERFLVRLEDDGSIRLTSYRSIAERGRGLFAHVAPKRSLADELIAERRGAASSQRFQRFWTPRRCLRICNRSRAEIQ